MTKCYLKHSLLQKKLGYYDINTEYFSKLIPKKVLYIILFLKRSFGIFPNTNETALWHLYFKKNILYFLQK